VESSFRKNALATKQSALTAAHTPNTTTHKNIVSQSLAQGIPLTNKSSLRQMEPQHPGLQTQLINYSSSATGRIGVAKKQQYQTQRDLKMNFASGDRLQEERQLIPQATFLTQTGEANLANTQTLSNALVSSDQMPGGPIIVESQKISVLEGISAQTSTQFNIKENMITQENLRSLNSKPSGENVDLDFNNQDWLDDLRKQRRIEQHTQFKLKIKQKVHQDLIELGIDQECLDGALSDSDSDYLEKDHISDNIKKV
jgi:hypothetical protein